MVECCNAYTVETETEKKANVKEMKDQFDINQAFMTEGTVCTKQVIHIRN